MLPINIGYTTRVLRPSLLLEVARLGAKQGLWDISREAARALQELIQAGSIREKQAESGSVALDLEFLLCEIDASAVADKFADTYTKRAVDVCLYDVFDKFR